MNDVPTLHEELTRKAVDTLEKVYLDHKNKRISQAQYAYVVDILWSVYSGIVGDDFMQMIEVMGKETQKDGSFFAQEYYHGSKGYVVKLVNLNDGRVRFELHRPGLPINEKEYDFREEQSPIMLAKEKFEELGDGLIRKDFVQI